MVVRFSPKNIQNIALSGTTSNHLKSELQCVNRWFRCYLCLYTLEETCTVRTVNIECLVVSYWNEIGQTSNRSTVDQCQNIHTVNSSLNIKTHAWLPFVYNESIWLLWYLHFRWHWHYISSVNIMRETALVKQFFINLTSQNSVIMNIVSKQPSQLPV